MFWSFNSFRFSWKMPQGRFPLSMTSLTKPPTLPSMLSLRFPGVWSTTLSDELDGVDGPILSLSWSFARWTNEKMEVDTKSPLHPIVQVTNFLMSTSSWRSRSKITLLILCRIQKKGNCAMWRTLSPTMVTSGTMGPSHRLIQTSKPIFSFELHFLTANIIS